MMSGGPVDRRHRPSKHLMDIRRRRGEQGAPPHTLPAPRWEAFDNTASPDSWACNRKKQYTDEGVARFVAARLGERVGIAQRPYACTRCGAWHIGRDPER